MDVCHQSMEALEYEVKALHVALEQVQATLTSPELARQSLKEQLAQRQVTKKHECLLFIYLFIVNKEPQMFTFILCILNIFMQY